MNKMMAALILACTAPWAHGQFSCTPRVPTDVCHAAETGSFMLTSVQKDLNLVVADPVAFASERNQLEASGKLRCEAANRTNNLREINRCATQATLGIDSNVLLEVTPEGSLQKIVISTDYFREAIREKTKFVPQADGTSKVELSYSEPSPAAAAEKMIQLGFFVLGYNSGQLNYMSRHI